MRVCSESSEVGACEDPAVESSGHAAAGDVEGCGGGAEPWALGGDGAPSRERMREGISCGGGPWD